MHIPPHNPPWPRVLSTGRWIEVTPGWILARLQAGLTPNTAGIIALAADRFGILIERLYSVARGLPLVESEAEQ
jgi:hypothetical protein